MDVAAPRTAVPGLYQGTFTVSSDQGSATVALSLEVWSFELPLQPALLSCFGNHLAGDAEARELLRHRLMPNQVEVSEERTLIDTLGLNGLNAGFWSGADGSHCVMSAPPSADQFQQAAAEHAADVPLYNYTADEVLPCTNLYPLLQAWARNLHQSRILQLVTIPPIPDLFDDGSGTGRSAVDIWVMLPFLYDEYRDNVAFVQQKGDQTWSYNCLVQDDYSPKWLLDYAPLNYRLQAGFLSQALGLRGLLYWSVDNWTSDPWTNVNSYEGGYPGEGILVYPGEAVGLPGQVVPSMRLKYLREGVDDYDYLALLQARGFNDQAHALAMSVAPDWRNWTRDPAAVEAARREAAARLENSFSDVPASYWAYPYIAALRRLGYVTGYGDDTYRPAGAVDARSDGGLHRAGAGGRRRQGSERPGHGHLPRRRAGLLGVSLCRVPRGKASGARRSGGPVLPGAGGLAGPDGGLCRPFGVHPHRRRGSGGLRASGRALLQRRSDSCIGPTPTSNTARASASWWDMRTAAIAPT